MDDNTPQPQRTTTNRLGMATAASAKATHKLTLRQKAMKDTEEAAARQRLEEENKKMKDEVEKQKKEEAEATARADAKAAARRK